MDDDLRERIERVRAALDAMPAGALVGSIGPGRHDLPPDLACLEQLADFLRVADGACCHEVMLYPVEDLSGPGPHDWLPGGAARWLTVGRNHVFPLVLDRQTQRVVELSADGAGEILRELGPFRRLVDGLFGDDYLTLAHGLGEEWDALLRCLKNLPSQHDVELWKASNDGLVRSLAQSIRQHNRLDLFPILADALEEAGCVNTDLLNACRRGSPHVDASWVLVLFPEEGE